MVQQVDGTSSSGSIAARRLLARKLLEHEIGQRLPSVQAMQQELGAGAGTIVKALKSLEQSRAIVLKTRGHQGTTLEDRHVGRLWSAASIGNFVLLMPPPGPVEQQASLHALRTALSRLGIALVVEYLAGAPARLAEVYQQRAHAAVMSAGAYARLVVDHPGTSVIDLGPGSYYAPGSLVLVRRRGAPMPSVPRVAIDRTSVDHEWLTTTQVDVSSSRWVDCSFVDVPARVLAGDADVGIWHRMPTVIPPELAGLELEPIDSSDLAESSIAKVVTRAVDAPTNAVLRHLRVSDVARCYREMSDAVREGRPHPGVWLR